MKKKATKKNKKAVQGKEKTAKKKNKAAKEQETTPITQVETSDDPGHAELKHH